MRVGDQTALQTWSSIAQTPELVGYFQGVFTKVGITVEETGESFTVVHRGDAVGFSAGLDPDVEFIVPVKLENVERLALHARDGRFDPDESWRIVQVLFTPLTRAALQSPAATNNWLRRLAGVEPLIHVHLMHPNGVDSVTHTLAYAGKQWLVIPGLHGRAARTYRLTPDQALTFQRQFYAALRKSSMGSWWQFANWYRTWRRSVSAKA
jgi:hypothetical protein